LQRFKFLFWNSAVCVAWSIALALVIPKEYTAKATILPPTEEQTGLNMSSLLRGLSISGVHVPLTVTPSDMVQSLLQSDRVLRAVASDMDPRIAYGIHDSSDAVARLRKNARFRVTPLGVVEISVAAPRADQAAALANAYVEELDHLTRILRMNRGRRIRIFVEGRLSVIRAQTDSLQVQLAALQSKHHAAALTPALNSSMEAAAQLAAKRMDAQFQLDLARSFASGASQEVRMREDTLAAIDRAIGRPRPLGTGTASVIRDLRAHESTLASLSEQYEDARIEETRDVVSIEALDSARPPRKPSYSNKRTFAAGALGVSILGGLGWLLVDTSGRPASSPRAPSRGGVSPAIAPLRD
jgi:hypothetical protein